MPGATARFRGWRKRAGDAARARTSDDDGEVLLPGTAIALAGRVRRTCAKVRQGAPRWAAGTAPPCRHGRCERIRTSFIHPCWETRHEIQQADGNDSSGALHWRRLCADGNRRRRDRHRRWRHQWHGRHVPRCDHDARRHGFQFGGQPRRPTRPYEFDARNDGNARNPWHPRHTRNAGGARHVGHEPRRWPYRYPDRHAAGNRHHAGRTHAG